MQFQPGLLSYISEKNDHKSQKEGLTPEEKEEQAALRKEYIASVKRNLKGQLDNIDMVNADGTVTNLGEKYGNKGKHQN